MKPKVLIVSYYWPPSGGSGVQRWVKFSKYLPDFGIEPIMLVPQNPTYPAIDKSLATDLSDDLKIYTSKSIDAFSVLKLITGKANHQLAKPSVSLGNSQNFLSKSMSWIRANIFIPDARGGWLLTARKKAGDIVKKHGIETVITTGPPHSVHFAGNYLKQKYGLKWIADFRDPWSQIYYNQLLPKSRLAQKLDLKLEKKILSAADEVIVISPSMIDQQKKIVDRNYRLITNGFDPADFKKPDADYRNEACTIRHIGTLSEAAVPGAFLQALLRLTSTHNISAEFIGNVYSQVQELVDTLGLSKRVAFKDYMPHHEAIQNMMSSDLLLLVIPNVTDNELILTGKLFEYLATGRPILMIGPKNGDAAEILRKSNQGACFGYDEVDEIADFLSRSCSGDSNLKAANSSKNLEGHPYSRITLTEQLATLINA